jgi:hypothetical protein
MGTPTRPAIMMDRVRDDEGIGVVPIEDRVAAAVMMT